MMEYSQQVGIYSSLIGSHAVCFGGFITKKDRSLNGCRIHSGECIHFEVVISTQSENSCRDQGETAERDRGTVLLRSRKLIFLPSLG